MTGGYGAHGAICLAASRSGYEQALTLLRNRGTMVCIGINLDELPITPLSIISRGLRIVGSSVGTNQEMEELMDMAARGKVKPIVKVFDFERLSEVLEILKDNKDGGKLVVRMKKVKQGGSGYL